MAFTLKMQLFGAVLFFALLSQVIGHSYVTSPVSRSNQKQTESGCRGPACLGPCDAPVSSITRTPIVAARGSTINIQWPRNNHAGGFIRFAWAPTAQSDDASVFDNHVQQINCHEVGGCGPSDPSNPNGGDTNPADGSSNPCQTSITVPADLTDGQWTLQWAWFGGAFALGDYYSCVDYQISGGASGSMTPRYVGGDFTYPNQQKCKFFNTDKLHQCVDEPCNNPIYPASAEESGPVASDQLKYNGVTYPVTSSGSSSSSTSTTGKAASTSTTGKPASSSTSTSTTGKPSTSTSTTGKPSTSTSTTGKPATSTSTTGKPASSSTSGKPMPSTSTSTSGSASSGSSSSCTTGNQRCSGASSYQICTNGLWSDSQNCLSGLGCLPNLAGDHVYCGYAPSSTPSSSTTPTSTTTAAPTTPPPSTTDDSSCTVGHMRCSGTSTYQTCSALIDSTYWSDAQSCDTGLSCTPTSDGNFMYCS